MKSTKCPHGNLNEWECLKCHLEWVARNRLWRPEKNPEQYRIYGRIHYTPEKYPLDDKCAFCEDDDFKENFTPKRGKLERGHLDYEDKGFNYLTVCHRCNCWMDRGRLPSVVILPTNL